MTPKTLVKMLVPPIVLSLYRRIRGPYWDGIYSSFRDVSSVGAGFNSDDYAIPTLNDTRRAMQIASNYRCVPTELVEEDAILPLVASLVRRNTEKVLRILDFGGGAGISFVHLKSGLVGAMELDYHVVELEWACRVGPQLFENDHRIHFHRSLPEMTEPLDIVFMKGVLMSIEDYAGLLKRLCAYRARYFLIVRTYAKMT
jgi:putative methyltransferase (TIGR04325 family)